MRIGRRTCVRPASVLGVALTALASVGCQTILGIDQDYTSQPIASSGGAPGSFFDFDGGIVRGSGGAVGTGGSPLKDAGADAEGGAFDPCPLGHYEGEFDGSHSPSANLIQVPTGIPVSIYGEVTFELQKDKSGRLVVVGAFESTTDPNQPAFITGFTARLEGTLDCEQGVLDAKLLDGHFNAVVLQYRFEGTTTGSYDSGTREVTGEWKENEIPSQSGAKGNGNWKAHYVGP